MKKGTYKDISGQRFGRLVAVKREGTTKHGESKWLCKCDCGKDAIIRHGGLTSGNTKSCGCLNIENLKIVNKTHGDSYSRLYKIWTGIKKRCYYKKDKNYYLYGGRGVNVCDEWLNDYENFKAWAMQNGYKSGLTIDRIDNEGNYEPNNCRWSDLIEQANNKRNNILFVFDGIKHTMAEWCRIKNLPYTMIWGRWRNGWNKKDMFLPPHSKRVHPLIRRF